jgi:asparagine synthase (glutamine-hydrolysing)
MTGIVGYLQISGDDKAEEKHHEMLRRIPHRGQPITHTYRQGEGHALVSYLGNQKEDCVGENIHGFWSLMVDSIEISVTNECREQLAAILRGRQSDAAYGIVVAAMERGGVHLYRSPDGTRPLYYAPLEDAFAFSTERKSIWALHTGFVRPIDPGEHLVLMWTGATQSLQATPPQRPSVVDSVDETEWIGRLQANLETSFQRLRENRKYAVLFSGGVDSALAALMTKKKSSKTLLVTSAAQGSKDIDVTERAADLLELDHVIVPLHPDKVWKALPEIIYSAETTNRMDIEIAIPFFFAAQEARKKRCGLAVSGQGPDELFAGYAKHEKILAEQGAIGLKDELWAEVSVTHEANIARDERLVACHEMEAFFPYLDSEFVKTALEIPATYLMVLDPKPKRKIIFRSLARKLGLPAILAGAKKHATQYSSGSAKMLMQSIKANVEDAKGLSKKKMTPVIQDVLDYIGNELGVPPQYGFVDEMDMDLGPIVKLQSRIRG